MGYGALSFLLATAYVPGVPSAPWVGRWVVLLVGSALLLLFRADVPIVKTRGLVCGFLLVVYAAVSCAWSVVPLSSLGVAVHYAGLFALFLLAQQSTPEEEAWFYGGLNLGISLSVILALFGSMGVYIGPVDVNYPTIGLLGNKDVLAEAAALVLILAVYRRDWIGAVLPLAGVLLVHSRGALLGLTCAGAYAIWLHLAEYRKARFAFVLCFLVAVAAIGYVDLYDYVRAQSLSDRMTAWQLGLWNVTPFGNGLGTYGIAFPMFEVAHNDFIQVLFEMGAPGFALATAVIIFGLLRKDLEDERATLVALLAIAFFGFPLETPLAASVGAWVAGRLSGAVAPAREYEPLGGTARGSSTREGSTRAVHRAKYL